MFSILSNKSETINSEDWGIDRAIANGETVVNQEVDVKFSNGREKTILHSAAPIYGEALKTIGAVAIDQDITKRKIAEKALDSQKSFLSAVLDHIHDAIVICDRQGRLLRFNESARKLHGIPEQPVSPDQWAEYYSLFKEDGITPLSLEEIPLYRALQGENFRDAEIVVAPRNHSPRHLVCNGQRLKNNAGKIIGAVVAMHDDTQRRIAEMEQKKLQTQLNQAQKMESIGSLAGGIAHDFNNILFPIVGLSEMMMEDFPEDSSEYQNLKEILTAGKRGSDLVNQILTFSRQSEDTRMPIQFQSVLKEVLKLCRSTIPTDITVHQNIQGYCGFIMANPTQLHQIAMNLITNAYHAVESTGGNITVKLQEVVFSHGDAPDGRLSSGRYAVLSVCDTGTGIDPAVMNKIFDPYFTTKEKGRGTGLGLATVYGIVKAHGGDIRVHSELKKGSSFHIYLPVLEKPSADGAPEKQQQSLPTGAEHILLVDDEKPVLQLEKQILERLGYSITSFSSSVDALAAFRTDPSCFDLIISDMNMPNLNGMQLAEKLIEIRSDIPVIICTGFSERINREISDAIGIKGFLMKPVAKHEMAEMVRKVLDSAK